jgi:ferredoxin-thioredoxin reductase catalytic subunit
MVLVFSPTFRYTQATNLHRKGRITMAVKLNEDKEMVKIVKDGLQRTGGYCPCRLERTEENKCICKEFREQIADPNFKGYCHCLLYYKD